MTAPTWESRLAETKEAVETLTLALSIFGVSAAEALVSANRLARVADEAPKIIVPRARQGRAGRGQGGRG